MKAIFSLLLIVFFSTSAQAWNLSDVSVLYPLPAPKESVELLLGPQTLIPWEIYKTHPVGFIGESGRDSVYDHLRVVGVRVDPEQKQIRMVWQPVIWDKDIKRFTTEDRAAHTFYTLSDLQFDTFLAEWLALMKSASSGLWMRQALGVHPGFRETKFAAVFRRELKRVLLKYCDVNSLNQYTAMELKSPDSTWWSFGGIQLVNHSGKKVWESISIPGIKGKTVDFFNLTQEHKELRGQFNFYGDDQVDLAKFVMGPTPSQDSRPQFEAALKFTARFQNPHRVTALKIDCASCHISQPVSYWIKTVMPGVHLRDQDREEAFRNPNPLRFDLNNNTIAAKSTRILRAFGYFGEVPAINQRVIHESALSAQWLNNRQR